MKNLMYNETFCKTIYLILVLAKCYLNRQCSSGGNGFSSCWHCCLSRHKIQFSFKSSINRLIIIRGKNKQNEVLMSSLKFLKVQSIV